MNFEEQQITMMAARIVGPYLLVAGAAAMMNAKLFRKLALEMHAQRLVLVAIGAWSLIAGLVLFAFHHHWSAPQAVAITLLAIATMLRGAAVLIVPEASTKFAQKVAKSGDAVYLGLGFITAIIGGWLAWVGWVA